MANSSWRTAALPVSHRPEHSLQIARQAATGPWLLRPLWRAVFWALTELPARVEATRPPPPAVPLYVARRVPEHVATGCGAHYAWAPSVTVNSSSSLATTSVLLKAMMAEIAAGASSSPGTLMSRSAGS